MPAFIEPSQLCPGDVLLYHGDSFLSGLIRLFDGTEYSHASIWNGSLIVEALGKGVVGQSVQASLADAKFVDVYRYRNKDTGQTLGDGSSQLPAQPVVEQANAFMSDHDRYAYEQILLLALLASTRQVTAPIPFLGMILRNLFDSAADVLARLIAVGKEPLICSELVYRCYGQSGSAYALRIRGADVAMASMVALAATAPDKLQADTSGYQLAAATFLDNYQAAKRSGRQLAPADAEGALPPGGVMTAQVVADFVTPGDLKKSPDLQMIGTLRV